MPCPLLLRRGVPYSVESILSSFSTAPAASFRRNIGKSAELYCYSAVIVSVSAGIATSAPIILPLSEVFSASVKRFLYVSSGDSSPSLTSNAITLPGSKVLAFGSFYFLRTHSRVRNRAAR